MRIIEEFGVSEQQLRLIVAEAMKSGGSWCDLYFENTVYSDFLLRDSEVSAAGCHIDRGCGIRVLSGEKTGYAYSESTDFPDLLAAVRAASSICHSGSGSPLRSVPVQAVPADCYTVVRPWEQSAPAGLIDFLHKIENGIRARESRTDKVTAMLSWSMSEVLMYNSAGELVSDTRPLGSISVQTVFRENGRVENATASVSMRSGSELIGDATAEDLISRSVDRVDDLFAARRPKGGSMPVVMGAGASGILLHEAMGHAFEADFNRKGQSIFAGRMGKRVCRPGINIVDDGTLHSMRGSCKYDDEGVPGQKTYMVTDGILTSYLHDRISASAFGVAPTGNGRRESFRYNPIPRMRSTYMESGSDGSVEDLIASVRKGIYVDQFANGQVKIGEGDFTFYVKRGYLIEDGRLTMPVKDINIIGNGPEALADIQAVAGDLKVDRGTWTCGKEQSVAVSCGMPSVLVGRLTVGGE